MREKKNIYSKKIANFFLKLCKSEQQFWQISQVLVSIMSVKPSSTCLAAWGAWPHPCPVSWAGSCLVYWWEGSARALTAIVDTIAGWGLSVLPVPSPHRWLGLLCAWRFGTPYLSASPSPVSRPSALLSWWVWRLGHIPPGPIMIPMAFPWASARLSIVSD